MMLKNFWKQKAAASVPAPTEDPPPASSGEPLQAVFSCYSPMEAHMVSGMLEDAGIEAVLSNEMFAYADSPISNASGGVQVLVRASDAEQAQELLHAAKPAAK